MADSTDKPSNVLRYEELKKRQLEDTISTQFYGVPIELGEFARAMQPHQNLIPIWGCVCVQDSPDNPCPCRWIVWLPKDRILRSGKTQLKSPEGHEIHWFRVANDARVLVERQAAVSVPEYVSLLETVENGEIHT